MSITALYRPYNASGRLLYVGIADDAEKRMDGHQYDHWYADVAAMDIALYPGRRQAKTAETEAIKTEWPLWNIHESPWGGVAAARARHLEGTWQQDKWGRWHSTLADCWQFDEQGCLRFMSPVLSGPPREWTAADERRLVERVRHNFHVRRLTRGALWEARYQFHVASGAA